MAENNVIGKNNKMPSYFDVMEIILVLYNHSEVWDFQKNNLFIHF